MLEHPLNYCNLKTTNNYLFHICIFHLHKCLDLNLNQYHFNLSGYSILTVLSNLNYHLPVEQLNTQIVLLFASPTYKS